MISYIIMMCLVHVTSVKELGTQGVELVFSMDRLERGTYAFSGAEWLNREGEPALPSCVYRIGIPQSGEVEIQIVEQREEVHHDVEIEPVTYSGIDEQGYEQSRQEKNPVYNENAFFPGKLVEASAPGVYRQLRALDIRLNPVQYNPVTREVKCMTYLKLRILFKGIPQKMPVTDMLFEKLYARTVVNYAQCRTWRLAADRAKDNPFAQGAWFKIEVADEGLYAIRHDELEDAGINPAQFDPKTMKIYTSAFELLPRNVLSDFADSLVEIPVYVEGEDDHHFNNDDYLVFYGYPANHFIHDSVIGWYENGYARNNVYWFTFGGEYGRRMEEVDAQWTGNSPDSTVKDIAHFEEDRGNPTRSGTNWYWLKVSPGTGQMASVSIALSHPDALGEAWLKTGYFTLNSGTWRFMIEIDSLTTVYDSTFFQPARDQLPPSYINAVASLNTDQSTMVFSILRPTGTTTSLTAYFNSVDLYYTRRAVVDEPFHVFYQGIGEYSLRCRGTGSSPIILDITDARVPYRLSNYELANNAAVFTTAVDSSHKLLYVSKPSLAYSATLIPAAPGKLRQSSPGADYLFITHPDFYSAIMPLVEYRRQDYSIQVTVVNDIYDDFSYGKYDPLAIKHFLYHTTQSWTTIPKYILLVGDATYDYKNNLNKDNPPNFIPMYEEGSKLSGNPGIPPNFIDEQEYVNFGSGASMILARITVRNSQEVRDYIDKVFAYETGTIDGMWNKRIILVGDDEYSNSYGWEGPYQHCGACENVLRHVSDSLYDAVKVYMVSYKPFSYPTTKPTAMEAYVRELSKGAYAGLFLGHGNTNQLADEAVFRHTTIPRVKNGRRLFFYYFGSCTVNRFDDSDYECIGEQFVRMKEGAIGTMGETAGCSPVGNSAIAESLFKYLTQTDMTMGECFHLARREEYLLLGDPAVRMRRHPTAMSLQPAPDSVRPLDKLYVSATENTFFLKAWVRDTTWMEFFDETTADRISEYVYRLVQNGSNSVVPFGYYIDGKTVYQGYWDIDTAVVITPRVSTIHMPVLKLSSLADNEAGMHDSVRVYGTAAPSSDETGPEILFYDGGRRLQDGAWVSKEFTLTGKVHDVSGINMLNSVYDTRGFYLYINQQLDAKIDLRDYFLYDKNSYTNGEFHIDLSLEEPVDTITVNVTDNYYNQTIEYLILNAELYGRLSIENFLIYPNPVRTDQGLWFTFLLSNAGVVDLEIFTIAGRLIKRIEDEPCNVGYNQIYWDCLDAYSDEISNGVYLVKARARSGSSRDEIVEKFIIAR
jgi:hypothetical protein